MKYILKGMRIIDGETTGVGTLCWGLPVRQKEYPQRQIDEFLECADEGYVFVETLDDRED